MLGNLNLFRTLNVGDTSDDRWDRTQRAWFVKPSAFLITSGEPKSLTRKRLTMPCRAKSAVNWARFALAFFDGGSLGLVTITASKVSSSLIFLFRSPFARI